MSTTYTAPDRKAEAKLAKEARDLSQEAVRSFANRVLARLSGAPRYQSIGRNKYVFVGDVQQAMDEEMYGDES